MRQSQGQIGVISAPICAFYHRSLGEFSIVSVQPCLLFSDSGSKLGQRRFCNYKLEGIALIEHTQSSLAAKTPQGAQILVRNKVTQNSPDIWLSGLSAS